MKHGILDINHKLLQCGAPQWCERWFRFADSPHELVRYLRTINQFVTLELLAPTRWFMMIYDDLFPLECPLSSGISFIFLPSWIILDGTGRTSWDSWDWIVQRESSANSFGIWLAKSSKTSHFAKAAQDLVLVGQLLRFCPLNPLEKSIEIPISLGKTPIYCLYIPLISSLCTC